MAAALVLITIVAHAAVTISQRGIASRTNQADRRRSQVEIERLRALEKESTVIFLTRDHAPSGTRPSERAAVG